MGWWIGGIIGLIIWIAIAFWPARCRRTEGPQLHPFFLLSLVFFPASLILATSCATAAADDGPGSVHQSASAFPVGACAGPSSGFCPDGLRG